MAGDVLLRLRPILPAQSRHDARDFGGGFGVGDQHGVVGRDHDHIVEAHRGDEWAFAPEVQVVDAFGEDLALQDVAVIVGLADATQDLPRADIAPRNVDRRDCGPDRMFRWHPRSKARALYRTNARKGGGKRGLPCPPARRARRRRASPG
jgi:hypothetical protein